MNRVPRKLLPEFAQLQATPAIAQCKRSTARWIRDFLLVSTLCQKQVKLKLQKSDAVLKLLPVPMISRQQRDNLFQDRFGKGRKLLAVAAERAELPDWFQVSPKTACKICTLYFFFPHTPPPPRWVPPALCGIQKQALSFSFQWKDLLQGRQGSSAS